MNLASWVAAAIGAYLIFDYFTHGPVRDWLDKRDP